MNPSGTGAQACAKTKKETFLEELYSVYLPLQTLSKDENKSVVMARHKETGQTVVIRSDTKKQPLYGLLCSVRHPFLPEFYDVYDFEDGEVVLYEYLRGITVSEVLETGTYAYAGAKKVLQALCDALSFLHGNGWVHRDVKPENVLITDRGVPVLLDFDAARRYGQEKSSDTLALGTVGYAPPEQYGIAQSDFRSDIYALGVLLNVMLTGTHPSDRLAEGKAGKIVRRCTQISPADRFGTVEELRRRL